MNQEILSSLEIDAIGEIINISLGASATAISTMLDSRVEITVPRVRVESYENFEFRNLEPAVAVKIDYIKGISGNNIMILKKDDIRVILETLMQTEYEPATFELDEIAMSAVCEVMNQMMGASATALSELLGKSINISTPEAIEITDIGAFKAESFNPGENFVAIEFDLSIEGKLKSEFINVMPMDLVKDMVASFMGDMYPDLVPTQPAQETPQVAEKQEEPAVASSGTMSQEEIEALLGQTQATEEIKEPASTSTGVMSQEEIEAMLTQSQGQTEPVKEESTPAVGGSLSQEEIEALLSGNSAPQGKTEPAVPAMSASNGAQIGAESQAYAPNEPKVIDVRDSVTDKSHLTGKPRQENLDMIMDVPLVVSVEIGRTKKPLKEILEITQGSLIVLDKMAGDQVELYANNKCIAKGDVVVVHDNFGIRVTEVMGKS